MDASKLYMKHNKVDLLRMQADIEADPLNAATGLYLYTPSARKKLAAIQQAITFHLADQRAACGNPVPCDGYSGRKSNKR